MAKRATRGSNLAEASPLDFAIGNAQASSGVFAGQLRLSLTHSPCEGFPLKLHGLSLLSLKQQVLFLGRVFLVNTTNKEFFLSCLCNMHNVPVGFEPFQNPGQIFAQFMFRKCWRFAGFYRSKDRIADKEQLGAFAAENCCA